MGGMFSAPHGALCAALLPYVMEANIRAARDKKQLDRFDEIAGILTGRAKAVEVVEWLLHLTADLKISRLRSWGVSRDRFDEIVSAASKASSMTFSPDNRFAYVINELDSTVSVFSFTPSIGKMTAVQTVKTVPPNFTEVNYPAEVEVHPTGRFLFGSNRGHNTLAMSKSCRKQGG